MYQVAHIAAFYEFRLIMMTASRHSSGIDAMRHMLRHNAALLARF